MVTTGSLQCICQWEILYHLVIRGVRITTWLNSITMCCNGITIRYPRLSFSVDSTFITYCLMNSLLGNRSSGFLSLKTNTNRLNGRIKFI